MADTDDFVGEGRCPPYTTRETTILDGKGRPIAICVSPHAANFICAATNQFCLKQKQLGG